MQAALAVLGSGAYLTPRDGAAASFTHAGNASVDHGWGTPPALLEALHGVFGRFDLDPCAPRKSRTRVRSRVPLTPEDDGLSVAWHGVVFVKPPCGRTLAAWVAKCRWGSDAGRVQTVVALLPARPETAYWHEQVAGRAAVFFLRG